jgi:hypothetical protein
MTSLRFRLTYKDDEPEVVCLLCSGQLGQQWGTQVTHHHEKGDGGSRQVTDDSELENKANFSDTKIFPVVTTCQVGSNKKMSFGNLKLKQYN